MKTSLLFLIFAATACAQISGNMSVSVNVSISGGSGTVPATVDAFIDFDGAGAANGAQPTPTTLAASTHGQGASQSWTIDSGPGLVYSTAAQSPKLAASVNAGGTVYDGNGTLGARCTSDGSGNHCGYNVVQFTAASTSSMSVGFDAKTSCPPAATFGCAAAPSGIFSSTGVDYCVPHFSPFSGKTGLYLETNGSSTLSPDVDAVAYSINTWYRINIQCNGGSAPNQRMTVCSISGANPPVYTFLGTMIAPGPASGHNPDSVSHGITGEEPAGTSYTWDVDNIVPNFSGLFSTSACLL